jgi:hypothetical protein
MLILLLTGCAPSMFRMPGPLGSMGQDPSADWRLPTRSAPDRAPDLPTPSAIATAAAGFVGATALRVDGQVYRFDCSGLVEASLASAGCSFSGSSAMLFEQARDLGVLHRRRVPRVGDIAFFDDTYDRNGNHRLDDPLSHVAIVEKVDASGTITLIHAGSTGVVRFVMNLRHPDERDDARGRRINDYLRVHHDGDSPRTRYLAGELWVAFASFAEAKVVAAAE